MRLRERLAGLTSPLPGAIGGTAPALRGGAFSGIAPALRGGASERDAASVGVGDLPPVAYSDAAHAELPPLPRPRSAIQLPADLARPERIAQLRALISEVVARDRERTPARAAGGGTAPALRGGAGGGTAPALRGGASFPQPLTVGETRDTAAGPLHLIERWLDSRHCHGRAAVAGALDVDARVLAVLALDPALSAVDPSRMLILDTETTGLSGGTGTVPFLIGLGVFDERVLKVEQLFLRNLGSEAPMLHHLAARLAHASMLVTYNGKAFDWPLLRARFVLNRVPLPQLPPHLDLLHCARRVLKARLGSVRLVEVECAVLGLRRDDDIDGADIPGRYLRYLRGEDPRTLLPVLAHNEQDVVALAALVWRLCAHFASVCASDDPLDHLAYARLALRADDLARAQAFADAAVAGGNAAVLGLQAQSLRALIARRRGDSHGAAHAWQQALAHASCELAAGRVHLALARLYERQLRDLAQAYSHARFTLPAEGPEAHGRRLGRLRRKLERRDR
jgi:uncharacterized protein YprB with RNaseH-like and TPR domain